MLSFFFSLRNKMLQIQVNSALINTLRFVHPSLSQSPRGEETCEMNPAAGPGGLRFLAEGRPEAGSASRGLST